MLGNFIRLVDYLVVEGVVDRAITTTDELLTILDAPRQQADKLSKVATPAFVETANSILHCENNLDDVLFYRFCKNILSGSHDIVELKIEQESFAWDT